MGGGAEDSVAGQGGGLRGFAMVRGDSGLVYRLGLVLERQQVRLLLLQPLVEPLSLALLLQLPPLELLSQSRETVSTLKLGLTKTICLSLKHIYAHKIWQCLPVLSPTEEYL